MLVSGSGEALLASCCGVSLQVTLEPSGCGEPIQWEAVSVSHLLE